MESLDDLFDDVPTTKKEDTKEPEKVTSVSEPEAKKQETSPALDLNDFNDAPMLPQDDDSYDLQKELEAKFDELFGPLDE